MVWYSLAAGPYEDTRTGPNQVLRPSKVLRTSPNQVLRPKTEGVENWFEFFEKN